MILFFVTILREMDFIIIYKKSWKILEEMPIHKQETLGYDFIVNEIDNTV